MVEKAAARRPIQPFAVDRHPHHKSVWHTLRCVICAGLLHSQLERRKQLDLEEMRMMREATSVGVREVR